MRLDYRDARPIHMQISGWYRDQIEAGILRQGDRLPSVRELASELTINPNTIHRAYRDLEAQGYIATVPGKGCFVCGHPGGCRPEQQTLLDTFDDTVDALLRLGVTREDLVRRLTKGEK